MIMRDSRVQNKKVVASALAIVWLSLAPANAQSKQQLLEVLFGRFFRINTLGAWQAGGKFSMTEADCVVTLSGHLNSLIESYAKMNGAVVAIIIDFNKLSKKSMELSHKPDETFEVRMTGDAGAVRSSNFDPSTSTMDLVPADTLAITYYREQSWSIIGNDFKYFTKFWGKD